MLIALSDGDACALGIGPGEARARRGRVPGRAPGEGLHLVAQDLDAAQVVALLGLGEVLVELAQPLAVRVPRLVVEHLVGVRGDTAPAREVRRRGRRRGDGVFSAGADRGELERMELLGGMPQQMRDVGESAHALQSRFAGAEHDGPVGAFAAEDHAIGRDHVPRRGGGGHVRQRRAGATRTFRECRRTQALALLHGRIEVAGGALRVLQGRGEKAEIVLDRSEQGDAIEEDDLRAGVRLEAGQQARGAFAVVDRGAHLGQHREARQPAPVRRPRARIRGERRPQGLAPPPPCVRRRRRGAPGRTARRAGR
jgi:hypothetical protein